MEREGRKEGAWGRERNIYALQENSCAEKKELLFNGISIHVNNVQIFHIRMYKEKKEEGRRRKEEERGKRERETERREHLLRVNDSLLLSCFSQAQLRINILSGRICLSILQFIQLDYKLKYRLDVLLLICDKIKFYFR